MAGISSLTRVSCYILCGSFFLTFPGHAGAVDLASHKAIYDIRLTSAKSGSQVLDVRGKMLYVIKKSCDGWISDHKFNLNYEYSGSPAVQVETKFTSFEGLDGKILNFSSNRMSNGELDQELRGKAKIIAGGKSAAIYSLPDDLSYKLAPETLFPAAHTLHLIGAAEQGQKLYNATVFDGSDDQGPVEINAVIGKKIAADDKPKMDKGLTGVEGWSIRLAVFPKQGEEQDISDYEMTMELLKNGVVKNMTVDYHDFSVSQKLVAIEPVKAEECGVE